MNKDRNLILLILSLLVIELGVILMLSDSIQNYEARGKEQAANLNYYEKLERGCEQYKNSDIAAAYQCCIDTVKIMERGGYQLALGEECPLGFFVNGLWCPGSYKWCEPDKINYANSYNDLEKECEKKSDPDCCLASVEVIKKNSYGVALGECPPGFSKNILRCGDSYGWCEPNEIKDEFESLEYFSCQEDADCKQYNFFDYCNALCGNKNKKAKTYLGSNISLPLCDTDLWDIPSLNCRCIKEICQVEPATKNGCELLGGKWIEKIDNLSFCEIG